MDSALLPFLLMFSLISAVVTAAQGGGGGVAARELWCVAKNNADDPALESALDWACGQGGADCGAIQNGGPCYDATDLQRTASFAFNDYYRKNGPGDDACSFANTAALTSLNPSHGNCIFPSSTISGLGNGKSSGPVMNGSYSSDLSSSGSSGERWNWVTMAIHLLFAVVLIL